MAEGSAGETKPGPATPAPPPAPAAASPSYDDLRAAAAQNLEAAQRFVDSGLSSAAQALRAGACISAASPCGPGRGRPISPARDGTSSPVCSRAIPCSWTAVQVPSRGRLSSTRAYQPLPRLREWARLVVAAAAAASRALLPPPSRSHPGPPPHAQAHPCCCTHVAHVLLTWILPS